MAASPLLLISRLRETAFIDPCIKQIKDVKET